MEKEEKRKLEQRIALLMGQMIRGERPAVINGQADVSVDGDPEIQNMMKEQQDKLRQEYEDKLGNRLCFVTIYCMILYCNLLYSVL